MLNIKYVLDLADRRPLGLFIQKTSPILCHKETCLRSVYWSMLECSISFKHEYPLLLQSFFKKKMKEYIQMTVDGLSPCSSILYHRTDAPPRSFQKYGTHPFYQRSHLLGLAWVPYASIFNTLRASRARYPWPKKYFYICSLRRWADGGKLIKDNNSQTGARIRATWRLLKAHGAEHYS